MLACGSLCSVDSAVNSLAQRVVKLLLLPLADPHLLYVRELIVDARLEVCQDVELLASALQP